MPNLLHGDCIEEMRKLPESSVDAIVCDPPYGLEFMGKEWDRLGGGARKTSKPGIGKRETGWVSNRGWNAMRCRKCGHLPHGGSPCKCEKPDMAPADNRMGQMQEWHHAWAIEALRILKPGGHLLAFGGTRTYHRLACAIEDAGFEIRDCLAWLYGSGFPKSHNLKDEWEGWGTALKPAHEPIVLARKPLTGTVAANVLGHGTGALNVDGCRVGADGGTRKGSFPNGASVTAYGDGLNGACEIEDIGKGRWPANVVLDPEAGAMLDEQSGEQKSGTAVRRNKGIVASSNVRYSGDDPTATDDVGYGDTGGASRFFYCAKASRRERNAGLEGFEERAEGIGDPRPSGQSMVRLDGRAPRTAQNVHPTVKPIALMRWLVRMVTPPNGTVLDPFLGSGTTGIAAKLEGFDFIGIERESEYLAIAQARIDHHEPEPEPAQLELAA